MPGGSQSRASCFDLARTGYFPEPARFLQQASTVLAARYSIFFVSLNRQAAMSCAVSCIFKMKFRGIKKPPPYIMKEAVNSCI